MPALAHLALHYLLGAWAAWCARRAPAMHAAWSSWPLALISTLAAIILVPCTTYQFRFYPDHALGYAVDPGLYPQLPAHIGPLSALAAVGYAASLLAGYTAMRHGLRRRLRAGALVPVGLAVAAVIAVLTTLGARAWLFGTYAQLWAGAATPWMKLSSAWATAAGYSLCAAMTHRLCGVLGGLFGRSI